jgi:hypothetical protein
VVTGESTASACYTCPSVRAKCRIWKHFQVYRGVLFLSAAETHCNYASLLQYRTSSLDDLASPSSTTRETQFCNYASLLQYRTSSLDDLASPSSTTRETQLATSCHESWLESCQGERMTTVSFAYMVSFKNSRKVGEAVAVEL